MSRITPTRQRNSVSQGMALGLLMSGFNSVPPDKVKVDLFFEGAWRSWRYKSHFPQVDTDIANGLDGIIAMTRADENKQVWLFWRRGEGLEIHCKMDDWDPNDPEDVALATESWLDGGVPLQGWIDLATDFMRRFER